MTYTATFQTEGQASTTDLSKFIDVASYYAEKQSTSDSMASFISEHFTSNHDEYTAKLSSVDQVQSTGDFVEQMHGKQNTTQPFEAELEFSDANIAAMKNEIRSLKDELEQAKALIVQKVLDTRPTTEPPAQPQPPEFATSESPNNERPIEQSEHQQIAPAKITPVATLLMGLGAGLRGATQKVMDFRSRQALDSIPTGKSAQQCYENIQSIMRNIDSERITSKTLDSLENNLKTLNQIVKTNGVAINRISDPDKKIKASNKLESDSKLLEKSIDSVSKNSPLLDKAANTLKHSFNSEEITKSLNKTLEHVRQFLDAMKQFINREQSPTLG